MLVWLDDLHSRRAMWRQLTVRLRCVIIHSLTIFPFLLRPNILYPRCCKKMPSTDPLLMRYLLINSLHCLFLICFRLRFLRVRRTKFSWISTISPASLNSSTERALSLRWLRKQIVVYRREIRLVRWCGLTVYSNWTSWTAGTERLRLQLWRGGECCRLSTRYLEWWLLLLFWLVLLLMCG
mgnify:CR=1 FL=1